eukprot:352594-Chlamydomonas_euryale.AAC.3
MKSLGVPSTAPLRVESFADGNARRSHSVNLLLRELYVEGEVCHGLEIFWRSHTFYTRVTHVLQPGSTLQGVWFRVCAQRLWG